MIVSFIFSFFFPLSLSRAAVFFPCCFIIARARTAISISCNVYYVNDFFRRFLALRYFLRRSLSLSLCVYAMLFQVVNEKGDADSLCVYVETIALCRIAKKNLSQ